MNALIISAFALGLFSSFHCIGMCGPIALAVPSSRTTWTGRTGDALLLNFGRIATYALLGLLFGMFGRGLRLAGLQQGISIALGAVILIGLLWPALMKGHVITGKLAMWTSGFRQVMARHLGRTSPTGLWSTGMLNGLLPCGLVYLALAGSLVQESPWQGSLFMISFGLGTIPALLAVRLGTAKLSMAKRALVRKLSPFLVAGMGVLFVLRGMGLGIPYISPVLYEVTTGVQPCHDTAVPVLPR